MSEHAAIESALAATYAIRAEALDDSAAFNAASMKALALISRQCQAETATMQRLRSQAAAYERLLRALGALSPARRNSARWRGLMRTVEATVPDELRHLLPVN